MNAQKYSYFLDEREEKSSRKIFVTFLVILICVFAIVFSVNIHFEKNYEYITINGLSMQPTLNAEPVYINGKSVQDGVYIKRGATADYGDIIIVNKREDLNKTIIKRLLGKGGDKITILKMSIDGKNEYRFVRIKSGTSDSQPEVLNETYINGVCNNAAGITRVLGYDTWTYNVNSALDSGNYYEGQFYSTYFWDNVNNVYIEDNVYPVSFSYQGVQYNNVKFYQLKQGQIFYMGDNRIESSDARLTGPEDESKILGKVVAITHNSTSSKNSIFYQFNRIGGYFNVLWQEIIKIFSWKA